MRQFYADHAEELLPIALTKGLKEFCLAFCDTHMNQGGQSNNNVVLPKDVERVFDKHFQDHQKFLDIVNSAYADLGSNVKESEIEAFYELIKSDERYASLSKSEFLKGPERRIICRLVLPKKLIKVDNPEFVSDMFQNSDEATALSEVASSESSEEIQVESNQIEFGRIKDPNRAKANTVMTRMLANAVQTGQYPSNAILREQIVTTFPDTKEWITNPVNQSWISKILSRRIQKTIKAGSKTKVSTPQSQAVPAAIKGRKPQRKALTPEREQVIRFIRQHHGKTNSAGERVWLRTAAMIEQIKQAFPELVEWCDNPVNKTWVKNTMGTTKFYTLHPSGRAEYTTPQSEAMEAVQLEDAPQPEAMPAAAKTQTLEQQSGTCVIAMVEALITDMRSGMFTPLEILKRGALVDKALGDHVQELLKLDNEFTELFESYKKLGIVV